MRNLEAVRDLARQRLEKTAGQAGMARFLWEREERLARNVDLICRLPEVAEQDFQVDRFCLISAAYFSQAGVGAYLESHNSTKLGGVGNLNNDIVSELCLRETEHVLGGLVTSGQLDKICEILLESTRRFTNRVEAMILSDARNLEDMGAVGLHGEFRDNMSCGKGLGDILQAWKRKVDYRYWEARVKEGFRFASVRKIAEKRLKATEFFMEQLGAEAEASDLADMAKNEQADAAEAIQSRPRLVKFN